MLFSCNTGAGEVENTDGGSTEGTNGSVEIDITGRFSIFMNEEYVCRVVCPDKPTDAEREIYQNVRDRLKNATKVTPEMFTDFKAYNDTGEERAKPAILVGRTNYEESKQVYDSLCYGESRIQIVGNKLVIAFSSMADGERLSQKFRSIVKSTASGYVSVDASVQESIYFSKLLTKLPKYPSDEASVLDGGEGSFTVVVNKSDIEKYKAYGETLESKGYERISTRAVADNTFDTFVCDTDYVYTYFTAYDSSVRIVGGPIGMLAKENNDSGLEETYTPYIASIPQPNNGQGYIFRLPDGRFIIHDGGYSGGDIVYKTLRKLEEGDITIAAWFISHPHGDHFPAFTDFITTYGSSGEIKIEKLMLNYAHPSAYDLSNSAGKENQSANVTKLFNKVKQSAPDLEIIKLHTGQMINFGSVSVEVLYTVEDILPRTLPNVNDSSLVIRLNVEGQTVMLLADTCYDSGPIMNDMWGDYLKSDIVQIAHHGIWPSVESIYHSIQGETVLFPAIHANIKNDMFDERWGATINAALKYAKDIYISGDALEIIELPYTPTGNKEAVLEALKNENQ
jgi:beta-lactamase superfamily II metal-dependent hydrolase